MQGEAKEHWIRPCAEASTEQDPDQLIKLVREINDLLEEKKSRLRNIQAAKDGQDRRAAD
jgi:hypothetical protein